MAEAARILVVDDELPVCKSLSGALAIENYNVDTALSAEEALRKEEESEYDIIITDLMMPGLSGMDLLRAVREKKLKTMVIMITGYPSIKSAVESIKLGAFDYIPKPFTPDELRSLVSRALKSKSYHDTEEIDSPNDIYGIPQNSWALIEPDGNVRIGVHHAFLRTIEIVTSLELPKENEMRYQGEACVRLTDSQAHVHKIWAPVSGRVVAINKRIADDYSLLTKDPYGQGWLLVVTPTDLDRDLRNLALLGRG